MGRCTSRTAKVAALLHDVVEDSDVSLDKVRADGFSPDVVTALRLLTRSPAVQYPDYIRAILANPTAIEVKIADLEDNSDIRRVSESDDATIERLKKYFTAYRVLTDERDRLKKIVG